MKFFFILLSLSASAVVAQTNPIVTRVNQLAVTEQAPYVFTPNNINDSDFEIIGNNGDITVKIAPKSFEWVRVERFTVFPRARVVFSQKKEPAKQLMIQYAGLVSFNETLMALTHDSEAIVFDLDGKTELGRFRVRYRPKKNYRNKVVIDTSCSPYGVALTDYKQDKLARSWVNLSCKMIQTESTEGTKPILELSVYWDNGSDIQSPPLSVNQQLQPLPQGLVHVVRLSSEQSTVKFARGDEEFTLQQKIPSIYHRLLVSAGVGPYYYRVDEPTKTFGRWVPFGTIYGAYVMSETLKLASFWAFPIDRKFQTDVGLYLITEQFRGIDERVSFNLLLGAHILQFSGEDQNHFSFSAPQGLEMIVRDVFGKRKNLSFGGFFYPTISGRSYINSWVRWGSSSLFYEVNFISWREPYDSGPVNSKSVGVSLGFPIFRLL